MNAQKSRNQKPAHSSVSIHEWMNRFELIVSKCKLDKKGKFVVCIYELVEVIEELHYVLWRGWHESSPLNSKALISNIYLRFADTARICIALAVNAIHETLMCLTYQATSNG